jgi:hypothetical protein
MLAVLLCALLAQDPVAAGVQDVTQLTLSAPRTITVVDTGKIPGSPVRLAWGPDGSLYVRVTDTDRWGNERSRHFVAMPTEKTTLAPTDGEPPWVPVYWTSKASTVAPGVPTMKLDVEQRRERNRIINAPSGGELAGTASAALPPGGGQGVSQGAAVAAANSAVTVDVVTLRLKGHVIAEWSGTTPQPATQLSWAPSPMGVLMETVTTG